MSPDLIPLGTTEDAQDLEGPGVRSLRMLGARVLNETPNCLQ